MYSQYKWPYRPEIAKKSQGFLSSELSRSRRVERRVETGLTEELALLWIAQLLNWMPGA